MKIVAIILARGGSKGIPGKNIIDFCGKPLLAWTIEQCACVNEIDSVWVSSDSNDILEVAAHYGARTLVRPEEFADDYASSESAWLHAINLIENKVGIVDLVIAPQVTSPLRERRDLENAINIFKKNNYDSMFSCSLAEDLFFWERDNNGKLHSINYDYLNRQCRQEIPDQYIENGSFYLFTPETLRRYNNRFGINIGCVEMEFWKMFEIDGVDDLKMCSALMNEFLLGKS